MAIIKDILTGYEGGAIVLHRLRESLSNGTPLGDTYAQQLREMLDTAFEAIDERDALDSRRFATAIVGAFNLNRAKSRPTLTENREDQMQAAMDITVLIKRGDHSIDSAAEDLSKHYNKSPDSLIAYYKKYRRAAHTAFETTMIAQERAKKYFPMN